MLNFAARIIPFSSCYNDRNVTDILHLQTVFTRKPNCPSIIAREGMKKMRTLRGCPTMHRRQINSAKIKETWKFSTSFILPLQRMSRYITTVLSLPLSLSLSLFLPPPFLPPFRSPSLRKAFTRRMLDYQRASLQQKLLVAVSRIESRLIDRRR